MSRILLPLVVLGLVGLVGCDKLFPGQQQAAAPQGSAPAPAAPAATPAPAVSPTDYAAGATSSAVPAAPAATATMPATPTTTPVAAAPAASAGAAPPGPAAALPAGGAAIEGPSLEVRSNVKQGFAYIAAAKSARSGPVFDENIENAINEFSQAIRKDPRYAEAYSDRAVAYMVQKKYNKAMDDLRKAVELAPQSPSVRYNLASLHSLQANTDLALDEIDAALTRGFNDYDALRKDPDLNNVRRHPEFRKVLERHKVFIFN